MTDQIPDGLIRYLAARDRERAQQVDDALSALTDRERVLVREAAVMGYVQGVLGSGGAVFGEKIPPDAAVLRSVVAACQAMPDLYPHLGRGDQ